MGAELGGQIVGLADGAEFSEDLVKVLIREVHVRLIGAKGFDVQAVMGNPCCLQAARTLPHSRK
jgi:hypothetical protein